MKKKWNLMLICALLLVAVSGGALAAASGSAGTANDPLVTLSYLNNVFAPSLNATVDKAVAANEEALKAALNEAIDKWSADIRNQAGNTPGGSGTGGGAVFSVVTLSNGQTLTGSVGCEIMLRVGSAVCVSPESPGLIDTTGGSTLNNGGALATNHLYMVTVETRGVRATSGTVKVLVRGSYTVA